MVTTATTGTGAYVLGAAVDGFNTPAVAGLSSGRRYSYVALNSLGTGGAPTQWERGYGILTNSGGTWTIARTVRRTHDGSSSAINWSAGTKYVALIADATDVALFDTDGWFQIGGNRTRTTQAPLDVQGSNSQGWVATFGGVFTITNDGVFSNKPLALDAAPTAGPHLTNKTYADGVTARTYSPASFYWPPTPQTAPDGYDPGAGNNVQFASISVPANARHFFMPSIYRGNVTSGATGVTVRAYLVAPNSSVIEIGGSQYLDHRANPGGGVAGYSIGHSVFSHTWAAGSDLTGYQIVFRLQRTDPFVVYEWRGTGFFILGS
jgi:hypothetical protein